MDFLGDINIAGKGTIGLVAAESSSMEALFRAASGDITKRTLGTMALEAASNYYNSAASNARFLQNVTINLPTIFNVTTSNATPSNPNLVAVLTSQPANTIFAAPNGSNGTPSFRALGAADIPTIGISGVSGLQGVLDGKLSWGGDSLNNTGLIGSTTNQSIQLISNSIVGLTLNAEGISDIKKLAVGRSSGQSSISWDSLAVFGGNLTIGGRDSSIQNSYDLNMVAHTTIDNQNNSTRKARVKFGYFDVANSIDKFKRTLEYWRSNDMFVIGSHNTIITDSSTNVPTEGNSVYFGANGSVGIASSDLASSSFKVTKKITSDGQISGSGYSILNNGVVQSDITVTAYYNNTFASTEPSVSSYNIPAIIHYSARQLNFGSNSTVTNQYAFYVDTTLQGATNNYGFYGNLGAATGRWNLYINGSANNYIAGNVAIGSLSADGYSLRVSKNMTSVPNQNVSYGILNNGQIQSDVSNIGYYFATFSNTASSSTINQIIHYSTAQNNIAGSVAAQYAFYVSSSLTGGTNNYGFYSGLGSGNGVWNLYMNGNANNYIGGKIGINTLTLTDRNFALALPISSTTPYSFINYGTVQANTMSVFMNYSQSNVVSGATVSQLYHYIASQGTLLGSVLNQYGFVASSALTGGTNNYGFYGGLDAGTGIWNFYAAGTASNHFAGQTMIGTTTPIAKLTVADSAAPIISVSRNGVGYGVIGISAGTNSSAGDMYFDMGQASGGYFFRTRNASNAIINAIGVDRNGNVGLGTFAPTAKLDVGGDIALTGTTGTNNIFMKNGNMGSFIHVDFPDVTNNSANFRLFRQTNTNGTKVFTMFKGDGSATSQTQLNAEGNSYINADSGNLGVGFTGTPLAQLHVTKRNIANAQPIQILEATGTGGKPYQLFKAEGTNYGYFGYGGSTSAMYLMNYQNNSLNFGTNNSFYMTILADGKVGVGTTSPTYAFEVNGNARFTLDATFNANVLIATSPSSPTHAVNKTYADLKLLAPVTAPTTGQVIRYNGSANVWANLQTSDITGLVDLLANKLSGTGTANKLPKWSGTAYQLTDSVLYDDGVRVGIGTNTPNTSFNLDVNGGLLATLGRFGNSTLGVSIANYLNASPRIATANSGTLDIFAPNLYFFTNGDVQTARLTATGLRVGQGTAAYKLDVNGDIAYAGTLYVGMPASGISLSNGNDGQFLKRSTGSYLGSSFPTNTWVNIGISDITDLQTSLNDKLSGNGTANYLSKYTASGTLGNSTIYDSGSGVGLGTTTTSQFNLNITLPLTGNVNYYAVSNSGIVQSDVTSAAIYYRTSASTATGSFTVANLVHFGAYRGALGSTVTNQIGYYVDFTLVGGTNANYAFYSAIPAGTGNWGLFSGGTANNFMAGSLGVGSTSLSNVSVKVSKSITGGDTSIGVWSDGQIQSEVSTAYYFRSGSNTQNVNFTIADLYHYGAVQGTFGAQSTVNNQVGFYVNNLNGAGVNMAIRTQVASGTNKWNLFLDGTANNHIAGSVWIGTNSSTYKFDVSGTGHFSSHLTVDGNVISAATPSAGNHLVNKAYVDSISAIKRGETVKTIALTNITLSGTQTINGVALVVGDLILVAGQSTASQNGVYVVASTGWTRSTNNDSETEIKGAYHFITSGTYANQRYINTNSDAITVGTTAITYAIDFGAEIDPVFVAHAAYNVTLSKINSWDTAVSWGNHASAGYVVNTRSITINGTAGRVTSSAGTQDLTSNRIWTIDLAASGVTAGTYKSVIVDTYGRVTSGSNPTTLSGYGITDALNTSAINGTINRLVKYGTASTLGNSIITDTGTNIGVGNASPGFKLNVSGDINTTTAFKIGGLRVGEWGQFQTHTQVASFASLTNWGTSFINGSATDMPNAATQWHVMKLSIGSEYLNQATYMAFGRPFSTYFDGKIYIRGIYGAADSGWISVGGSTDVKNYSIDRGEYNALYKGIMIEETDGDQGVFIGKDTINGGILLEMNVVDINTTSNTIYQNWMSPEDGRLYYITSNQKKKYLVEGDVVGNGGTTYTGVTPINVSATGAISIDTAGSGTTGALTATDWNRFNSKFTLPSGGSDGQTLLRSEGNIVWATPSGSGTPYTGASPISVSGTSISIATASASQPGALSATDWTTFNNKFTLPSGGANGNVLVKSGNSATWAVMGSGGAYSGYGPIKIDGVIISIDTATALKDGALSAIDWGTFNNKFDLPADGSTGNVLVKDGTSARWSSNFIKDADLLTEGLTFVNSYSGSNALSSSEILFRNINNGVPDNVNTAFMKLDRLLSNDTLRIGTAGNIGFELSTQQSSSISLLTNAGNINFYTNTGKVYINGIELDMSSPGTGKVLKMVSPTKAGWANP